MPGDWLAGLARMSDGWNLLGGRPARQLTPISPVRSDNLRLVKDAETVRIIALVFADAKLAYSARPDSAPRQW